MKKTMALVLALALLLGCTAAVAEETFDASQFTTWFEEEGVWRTVTNDTSAQEGGTKGGFITDASGAPTKEDLEAILHTASLAVTSGGKADWYMVAVTDPEEQKAIIGDKYGIATSEGTVTVLDVRQSASFAMSCVPTIPTPISPTAATTMRAL